MKLCFSGSRLTLKALKVLQRLAARWAVRQNLNDRLQLPQTIISLSFTIVIIRFFIIIIVNIINYHHLSMYYTICFHVELKVGIEALKSLFSLNPRSGELATAGVLDRFRIMISRLIFLDMKIWHCRMMFIYSSWLPSSTQTHWHQHIE